MSVITKGVGSVVLAVGSALATGDPTGTVGSLASQALGVAGGLMSGVAGNFMHDALEEAGPALGASLLRRHTEIDRNHHIVLALRLSHLDALNAILDRFDAGRKSESDPVRKAEGTRISALLRAYAKDARQFDGEAAKDVAPEERRVLAALPAAFETALAGRTGSAADANIVRREMELAVVQELAKEIGDDLPAFLIAAFHGDADGRDGWHDLFVRAACARLKDNAAFGAIWSAELLAGSCHRIRSLLDLTSAIDRKTDQLLAGQNATEEAAERRHRENLAFQQTILDATAREKGVSVSDLRPVLTRLLGHSDVPLDQIGRVLGEAVDAMLAQSQTLAVVHNDEPSIDRAINLARQKLRTLDIDGALATVRAAQKEEEEAARMRDQARARLFFEEADILTPLYDHAGVIAALRAGLALDATIKRRWGQLGDEFSIVGSRDEAENAYRAALAISQNDYDDPDAGASFQRIGSMRYAKGDTKGALDAYLSALKIAATLANRDSNNPVWQHHLCVNYNNIGNVRYVEGNTRAALNAYAEAFKIAKHLTQRDPMNAEWQRELCVSYNHVGSIRHAEGDATGALEIYINALEIAKNLAEQDPSNALRKGDLRNSYSNVGKMRCITGDMKGALASYEDALKIQQHLAESDPDNVVWQHNLSVSYISAGELRRAYGDAAGALNAYENALKILQYLAEYDPRNVAWQEDLSASHSKIGDIRRIEGNTKGALDAYSVALKIALSLTERDPGNAMWQHLLSTCHSEVGGMRHAEGDSGGALDAYNAALETAIVLSRRDPDNTLWQRHLSVTYNNIGDLRRDEGDTQGAFDAYATGYEIRKHLAKRDPGNVYSQRDMIISLVKLAETHPIASATYYAEALAIAKDLAATGRLAPLDAWMPGELTQRLADAKEPTG